MKLYKIRSRYNNVIAHNITLPASEGEMQAFEDKRVWVLTGKKIVLSATSSYVTGDPIEIQFLRKQSGVLISGIEDSLELENIKLSPEPNVGTDLTEEEAQQYKFKDVNEEVILDNLKRLGYITEEDKGSLLECSEDGEIKILTEELMVARMKELGYTLYKKKHLTGIK